MTRPTLSPLIPRAGIPPSKVSQSATSLRSNLKISWPIPREAEDIFSTKIHSGETPWQGSTRFHSSQMLSPGLNPHLYDDPEHTRRMRTRVAIRDKSPHHFQVIPLRDARDRDVWMTHVNPPPKSRRNIDLPLHDIPSISVDSPDRSGRTPGKLDSTILTRSLSRSSTMHGLPRAGLSKTSHANLWGNHQRNSSIDNGHFSRRSSISTQRLSVLSVDPADRHYQQDSVENLLRNSGKEYASSPRAGMNFNHSTDVPASPLFSSKATPNSYRCRKRTRTLSDISNMFVNLDESRALTKQRPRRRTDATRLAEMDVTPNRNALSSFHSIRDSLDVTPSDTGANLPEIRPLRIVKNKLIEPHNLNASSRTGETTRASRRHALVPLDLNIGKLRTAGLFSSNNHLSLPTYHSSSSFPSVASWGTVSSLEEMTKYHPIISDLMTVLDRSIHEWSVL